MNSNRKCKVLVDLKDHEIYLCKPKDYGIVSIQKEQQFDMVASQFKSSDSSHDKLVLRCQDDDMYKTVYPGQQICFDEGRLACKVVAVYEHRVTVECLNDYIMTSSIKMMIPKGKMDDQLIQEK